MSKRKADEISPTTKSSSITDVEEVIQVPVRSREKRRAVRKVAASSTTTNDQTNTTEVPQTSSTTRIVTSEVPSVITVVKPITPKEQFSKKEKEALDENFGKFMFTLSTYFHRGFSDFKLSAINELYMSNGDLFNVETLKMIQYIVPELFTIYLNHNQEICVNISNEFTKIKSSIVGMWKKRIATAEKPQSETQFEVRALNIATTKPLPKIENSTMDKTQQSKKSIEEMLKENDRKEQEELERAKILSKKFEIDRVIETLLIMFTILKMKKKSKMDMNTLVQELKNRYTKETTVQELRAHLELLCKHVPTLFTLNSFGNLKVFEMSKDAKFENAKKTLEENMGNQ